MVAKGLGSIAVLIVGGVLASVSILGMVNSQVNSDEQVANVNNASVPYGK